MVARDFADEDMRLTRAIEDAIESWEEGDNSVDQHLGLYLRIQRSFKNLGYGEWV